MAGILKVDKYQDFNGNDIMTSDGAGNLTINNAALKNAPAFEVSLSADQTLSAGVETLVAFDTIHIDTGNYFSTSTRRFTPQVAGKYYIYGLGQQFTSGNTLSYITIRKNNVRVARFAVDNRSSANGTSNSHTVSAIVDMNGTTDYVDLYCNFNGTGSPVKIAAWSTGNPATLFGGYRLIGA